MSAVQIVKFITDHVAEDIELAKAAHAQQNSYYWNWDQSEQAWREAAEGGYGGDAGKLAGQFSPHRVIAECEAKISVLELHAPWSNDGHIYCEACGGDGAPPVEWPCPTLKALAKVWDNHPDFISDWGTNPGS